MPTMEEESKPLAELYDAARTEGSTLTVYAGGDTANQQDGTLAAFDAAFPDTTLDMMSARVPASTAGACANSPCMNSSLAPRQHTRGQNPRFR
jgi:hypothetical protein